MPRSVITGATILVVDDNESMLKLIGLLLEEQGVTVKAVTSVSAARLALESSSEPYDLVLSDISMPGETGFDLLAWIKGPTSPYRDVPVLLMTAQLPEPENRMRGFAMGAVDYVERPIDLSELVIRTMNAVGNTRRLRRLEMSLQDSEKLALVGRLLAASNHEIKNLATLVRLATSMTLKHFAGATGEGAKALQALDQSSALLADVAKSVSALLSPGAAAVRPFDLTATVREVTELMTKRVNPVFLDCVPSGVVWADGNAMRVKQVLINLILNAFDAIQELAPDEGGYIRVEVRSEGGECTVSVRDNGIGLSAPGERRTFDPFVTTKKLRGGTGLGLWLSATLMQNMNGGLSLASAGPARGAEAKLTLKASVSAAAEPEFDISQYFIDDDGV